MVKILALMTVAVTARGLAEGCSCSAPAPCTRCQGMHMHCIFLVQCDIYCTAIGELMVWWSRAGRKY